ncbi:rhomboid family intramembrane serine protease [Spiroplasma culicicola]|uniref:Putative rhomboid-like transmembrane protein n=1 Tax=Spiroplasma culicicola AES-1 TaxID=1276246 RepID=W6A884_9MOLU|nr:rhomboid family intramembrane serine protease [Spiroplasma culicicola]AHI53105.1 putative rhomboid-like transmembrane protein [Spiroplasma culicicola AES-1]
MAISNNDIKLSLVHYFIKVEKYKANNEFSNNYISYLINPKNRNQIIVISIGQADNEKELKQLKESLKTAKREHIEVLNIIITDQIIENSICISSFDNIVTQLGKYYPKIVNLKEPEKDEEQMSEEEMLETLQNPSKSSNIKLKNLVSRMQSNSFVSMGLTLIFFVIPIVCFAFWFFIAGGSWLQYSDVSSLFFGGTNKALTIYAGQYWRIFTYGFNTMSLGIIGFLFETIIMGAMVLKLSKYTEGIIGSWKFALIMFITYPMTGLFVSVMVPGVVFSGILGFMASVIASLGVTTWVKKNDPITLFSKNRLLMPIIIMILYALFFKSGYDLILIVAAAGIAGSMTMLFTYDYSKPDFYLAFPIIMLVGLILMPIICIFIPTYSLAPEGTTIYALIEYARHGILSVDKVNEILLKDNGWHYWIDETLNLHSI